MKRLAIVGLMFFVMVVVLSATIFASQPNSEIIVNGRTIVVNGRIISNPKYVISETDGNVILDLCAIAESLGFNVAWDGIERRVDIGGVYSIWINKLVFSNNASHTTSELCIPPIIIDGRTFVPISLFNYAIDDIHVEISDDIISVERLSLVLNIVSVPDTKITLWTYPISHELLDKYDTIYDIDTEQYTGVALVIWTNTTIYNFQFFEIALQGMEYREGAYYLSIGQILSSVPQLSPCNPFAIRSHFGGAIPVRGISFEDEYGAVHYFLVNISGMDGSVEIMPYPLNEMRLFF